MEYLLVLLIAVPTVGALVCALLPGARSAKTWALLVSFAVLAIAIALGVGTRDYAGPVELKPGANSGWSFPAIGFSFHLACDAISYWLILLTAGLTPLAVAASYASIRERQKEYYAWMLALLAAMLGVFVARDLLLFYVFFELTLVPMFFIIGIWGGPERRYAAAKFFLFTFAGSVFTLAAAVYLGVKYGTFDLALLLEYSRHGGAGAAALTSSERFWIVMGLLAGFAVKVPLFPVHTWLPLAHTEAPTAGSVILAGVLLKLGTYGLLRLALPFGLLDASGAPAFPTLLLAIGALCIIGIIYGALVAWVQQDIKKLVAYSSVSHLGFCVLGLAALNVIGVQGSILYMINHGLSTGAMFLVIGMIYDRFHTRDINALSGLARRMPKLAFFFVLFVLSSIGLPGLNGFWSEFLTILGAFTSDYLGVAFGALAALGIILGAVYMLHMTARVIWGPLKFPGGHGPEHGDEHGHGGARAHALPEGAPSDTDQATAAAPDKEPEPHLPEDLSAREVAILVPIALACIVLGVKPGLITDSTEGPVTELLAGREDAAAGTETRAAAEFSPSPGTPGEGRGEGLQPSEISALNSQKDPHPSPLPEYRARGPEAAAVVDNN